MANAKRPRQSDIVRFMFFSLGAARTRLPAGSIENCLVFSNYRETPKPPSDFRCAQGDPSSVERESQNYDVGLNHRKQKNLHYWKPAIKPLFVARPKVNPIGTPAQDRTSSA